MQHPGSLYIGIFWNLYKLVFPSAHSLALCLNDYKQREEYAYDASGAVHPEEPRLTKAILHWTVQLQHCEDDDGARRETH